MSSLTRGIATLCAVAALGGAVATASAAPVSRAATGALHATHVRGSTTVHLDAAPTGDGPADAEVCNSFAANITSQQNHLVGDLLDGDFAGALGQVEAVSNMIDMAEDAGCFIVY